MEMNEPRTTAAERGLGGIALNWSAVALVVAVWTSAMIFGVYILIFFAGGLVTGDAARWNQSLPDLFNPDNPVATLSIGIHFLVGGIILALGPIQLFARVREWAPRFHHWTGRLYITTTLIAAVGGLLFIALEGTLGGLPMDLGFGLFGVLMFWASIETYRHARARRIDRHRAWALRLFSLAIASWLYRMEYGFWFLTVGELGHTSTFDGPFDIAMSFLFYLPNLAVVEIFLRTRGKRLRSPSQWVAAAVFAGATTFIVLATYKMIERSWGPRILDSLSM
jgi:hypothetical protein